LQINWVFLTEKNIVVILCDSCEVRTESRFHFVVLLSTLLHAILHPSHHLLNVLLQDANKLGLTKKKLLTKGMDMTQGRNDDRVNDLPL
jgi:hypothetical protein